MQLQNVHSNTVRAIRRKLLAWYDAHRRDLPWRSDPPNAWAVLVSEAMLQQTQVTTVIDYFNRFMKAWPTPAAMAAADEQDVLRMWQGLGYYRRARNLHAAAKAIVDDHAGRVPDTVDELLTLPGVGRYTAGAVASIAYNRAAPIVDGNVMRVLSRWFAIEKSVDETPVKAALWELAERMTPGERPGDFNQAMMELGALVCTPRNAKCLVCPVQSQCQAQQRGLVEQLPVRSAKRKPTAVTHVVLAARRGGQYLFTQRPSQGLWSNMWELPTAENGEDAAAIAERAGLTIADAREVGRFSHQTTHRTIAFVVMQAAVTGGRLKRGAGMWRALDETDDLPMSKAQVRAVEVVNKKKPTA